MIKRIETALRRHHMLAALLLAGLLPFLQACSGGRSEPFTIDPQETLPLTVDTVALQSGQVGVAYSVQLQARGGGNASTVAYIWNQVGINGNQPVLPQGLSFSSNGLLSGIPRQAWNPTTNGKLQFQVRSSDGSIQLTDEFDLNIDGDGWASSPGLSEGNVSAPGGRFGQTSVWAETIGTATQRSLIVWGGQTEDMGTETFLDTGSIYSSANDNWSQPAGMQTGATSAPSARTGHVAVWADDFMIVWGGRNGANSFLSDGAIYFLQTDSWSQPTGLQAGNGPSARGDCVAAWDSTRQMLYVYGGRTAAGATAELHAYDPTNDQWMTLAPSNPTLSARYAAVGGIDPANTGSFVIHGGRDATNVFRSGAIYNIQANSWSQPAALTTGAPNGPSARHSHAGGMIGDNLVLFGGNDGTSNLNDGDVFDLATMSWLSNTQSATVQNLVMGAQRPTARRDLSAAVSPTAFILYGGIGVRPPTNQEEEWGEARLYVPK
ncbi:MAG: hypothetical protein KDB07_12890 [Planctomycetes bacterium]|nr:hypothetical protein [Planctomycetota bacterium]